jgi:hypothetical protein
MIISSNATILDEDNKVIAFVFNETEVESCKPSYAFYDAKTDLFAETNDKLAGVMQDENMSIFFGEAQYGND